MLISIYRKYVLFLILGSVLVSVAYFIINSKTKTTRLLNSGTSNNKLSTEFLVGKQLPYFNLKDINGSPYSTNEQMVGECLLIFFSALDCQTCLSESKYWQKLHVNNSTIKVFGVTRDKNLNMLRKFLDLYNLTFPILFDHQEKLFSELKIEQTPLKILVDANKIIRKVDNITYLKEEDFKIFLSLEQ